MKQVHGIWLPDGDIHISDHLGRGPVYKGKGTYQFAKIEACILACEGAKRTGLALDIGAHVGTWTRVLADIFAEVVAFEPMPHLYECLIANTAGMGNVHLNNVAVTSNGGQMRMITVAENSGNCRVATERDRETITVRAISLDRYERAFNRAGVDFIKIDVEGHEFNVLKGGENTIKRFRPFIMIEQKHGDLSRRYLALDLLKSWGMEEVYTRSGDYLLRFP